MRKREAKGTGTSRRKVRTSALVAVAVTEFVTLSPAQASDATATSAWGGIVAQGISVMADAGQATPAPGKPSPVGQPATDYHPKPKVGSIDHIAVPSPEVSRAEAVMAADAHTIGPISTALHGYTLHPAQLISVRNYIGQYDEKTKVVAAGSHDGISVFRISDAATGKYLGQVEVSAGSNGEVVVSKVNNAQFDAKTTVEFQVAGQVNTEEAKQVIGGSTAYGVLSSDKEHSKIGVEMPSLASIEIKTDLGKVSESSAHFYPDGSGYEFGISGQYANGHAEDKLSVTGVDVGVGINGPGVKGFINYFGKPEAEAGGRFSRSVYGATMEAHMTLAEIEAKYGCTDGGSCGAEAKMGAFGAGGGPGIVFSPHVDIPVRPASEIEDTGIAAAPPVQAQPPVTGVEQAAFDKAAASGDTAELEDFVETYSDSALVDEANNLIDEHAAPSESAAIPVVGY